MDGKIHCTSDWKASFVMDDMRDRKRFVLRGTMTEYELVGNQTWQS